jgi:hypothetical protein
LFDAIIIIIAIAMYAYAGHQTWWRMLLTDPNAEDCRIAAEFVNGTLPFRVYALFVVGWLPLMVLSWTNSKHSPVA